MKTKIMENKSNYAKTDPRSRWKPAYVCIKLYPSDTDVWPKLGMEVSAEGYTKNGVIPIVKDVHKWPKFWHKLPVP